MLSGRCWRGGWEREGGRERERAKGKCTSVDARSIKMKEQRDGDQGVRARKMPAVPSLVNKYKKSSFRSHGNSLWAIYISMTAGK